jgi:acetyl esterase/lipase
LIYTHGKVCDHLAKAIGCRALILDYRRTPEHVHSAPVDDAVTAYRWLLDQGIEPGHIALTCDSAGGALAVTTLLRARERNLPMPAATMPLSPCIDMEITGEALVSNREKDVLVQKEIVEVMATTFLGEGGNRKDPLANPLYANLKGLPPIYIQVGGDETLLDDSRRLAERARKAGVDVRLDVFPELQHVPSRRCHCGAGVLRPFGSIPGAFERGEPRLSQPRGRLSSQSRDGVRIGRQHRAGGACLREADMSGAQLDAAVLIGADLRKANLRGAGFRRARLDAADLRDARLGGAFLVGASLRGADLRGTYLRLAKLDGADLSDANLEGVEGLMQGSSIGPTATAEQSYPQAG